MQIHNYFSACAVCEPKNVLGIHVHVNAHNHIHVGLGLGLGVYL